MRLTSDPEEECQTAANEKNEKNKLWVKGCELRMPMKLKVCLLTANEKVYHT